MYKRLHIKNNKEYCISLDDLKTMFTYHRQFSRPNNKPLMFSARYLGVAKMGAVPRNGSKKRNGSVLSTSETGTIQPSIFYFLLFPISSVISPQEILHTSAVPIAISRVSSLTWKPNSRNQIDNSSKKGELDD